MYTAETPPFSQLPLDLAHFCWCLAYFIRKIFFRVYGPCSAMKTYSSPTM